jgi:hypothetical protein
VAGSRDVKFVALAESMRHRLPNARCALVEGVGHAAHLEDADAFSQIARGFLAEVDDAMPAPLIKNRSTRDRRETDAQTDVQE